MRNFRVAAIQMNARLDRAANLAKALAAIDEAAAQGVELIVLPELFTAYGDLEAVVAQAEPIPGPTSEAIAERARRHGTAILAGSIAERSSDPSRAYNTSLFFFDPASPPAVYRKMHLFDVDLPGRVTSCESRYMLAGEELRCTDTPLACFGQAICYDLRFPELFRALVDRGAEVLLVPSAFTSSTGRAHWEVLLRARAVENQCYVVAANQCGAHNDRMTSYGRSMIVNPWGRILAQAEEEETVIYAELSASALRETRDRLPALKNRRLR